MATLTSYLCAVKDCSKVFDALREYNQHKNTHEKPWKCPERSCDKSFGLRSDRDRHVKCKHQIGNTKFSCSFDGCEFRATRKDNLMQHRRKRHGLIAKSARSEVRAPETIDCSTLMRAANTGRIDVLQLCLRSGLSVNLRADDGFTALHCAARMNQVETLEYLLRCGADTNAYSERSSSTLPIHEAIMGKSLECFQQLLQAKSKIKSPDGTLKDIVHCITAVGDSRIAQRLLGAQHSDVEVNATVNALALAAAGCGQLDIMKSLISSHPEEVKVAANSRQSPLYLAAKRGHLSVVESLLNLFESRKVDNKALILLRLSMRAAAKRGHTDVLRLLVQSNEIDLSEIMEVAVENEQLHVVEFLARRESQLHQNFNSALRKAVKQDHVDIVSCLASLGPFDSNDSPDPVLHLAIDCRSWATVEALLQTGNENVNVKNSITGLNALHKSVRAGHILAMKLLLQHKDIDVNEEWKDWETTTNALNLAMANGSLEAFTLLLREAGLDINRVTAGESALHRVIKEPSPELLVLLLQHPDINVNVMSGEGKTPLELTLRANVSEASDRSSQDKLSQLLIDHQSFDLSTWDKSASGTLLGILEKFGYWSSFELLLGRKNIKMPSSIWSSDPRAMQIILRHCEYTSCQTTRLSLHKLLSDGIISANARTPEGKTLLHYAAENNEEGLMRDLLSHKELDPDQKYLSHDFGYSEGHQTPMGIAKAWGHSGIVDLLRKHGNMYAILN